MTAAIHPALASSLEARGYAQLTPVQMEMASGHHGDADLLVSAQTGSGGVGTWSTAWPALLGTPIDHIMATDRWEATGSVVLGSLDASGSDHRPLIVQYDVRDATQPADG